jgi:hypothetical protein
MPFTHTAPPPSHPPIRWRLHGIVEKRDDDRHLLEVVEFSDNALMYGGASVLWHRLIGGTTVDEFDNTNAHIGVGDSSSPESPGQTNLLGANKDRQPMEATFPTHTDGTTNGSQTVTFKSEWGSGDGNFAWNEVGLFNAASGGRMLNRRVVNLGTKSGGTWTVTLSLTLEV